MYGITSSTATLFDIGEGDVQVGAGRTTTQATVVLDGGRVESGAAVATGCRLPLSARDSVGVAPNRITSDADRRTVRASRDTGAYGQFPSAADNRCASGCGHRSDRG